MNLANKLTIARVVMVPLFVLCFYIPWEHWSFIAAIVFVVAFITDVLDGYVARKFDMVTDFGKFLDPIADKLLTAAAFIMLSSIGKVDAVMTIIIISREFIISGMRMLVAESGVVIAASWLGKAKTVTQFIAVLLVLCQNIVFESFGIPMDQIMLWICTIMTVWSGADYVVQNGKFINTKK